MKLVKVCIFSLLLCNYCNAQKLTDTIFYNQRWQICEKPIAEYYRIGTLAIDSFWFFTGIIKDYTADDNTLIMKGVYSEDGYKNGAFEFYFPNANVQMKGSYSHDKMNGTWEFFYEDGKPKATILLSGEQNDFTFVNYFDRNGNQLLKDGTGEFTWQQNEVDNRKLSSSYDYVLFGEFKDSLRTGTWKYYSGDGINMNTLRYREIYTKGKLKKATSEGYYSGRVSSAAVSFDFQPQKIYTTEKIAYDEFLTKHDSAGKSEENFINYIINEESPGITLKEKNFTKAFQKIIATLERHRSRINYAGKDIQGEIVFKIGDKGSPEDVTVTGNITEKEKTFIRYLMDKFKGIEMPTIDSTIAVEGYHKFYFYTFNPHPFVPAEVRSYIPDEDFTFSSIPREKFLEFAKSIKKVFRKALNRM